ncbi:MAG TPA: hypothetical protein VMW75_21675, partial [Thermoanaerobaculia bacterium]|nr:hypothetical protein [Thermoanaerobaculia bacterium]
LGGMTQNDPWSYNLYVPILDGSAPFVLNDSEHLGTCLVVENSTDAKWTIWLLGRSDFKKRVSKSVNDYPGLDRVETAERYIWLSGADIKWTK